MLHKFDIICLLETFMTEDVLPANILSQYKRYFTPAKKLSKHGRCSGGVIVFVKHTLKNCVLEIKCKLDNVITLKLNNYIGKNRSNDAIIIFAYIPPYQSSYYEHLIVKNGIQILEDYVSQLKLSNYNSSFIICGDLNARTSSVQPILQCNEINNFFHENVFNHGPHEDNLERHSSDNLINTFGRSLIDMCATLDLTIMNGHCTGDEGGAFTFISPNGNSVVDYFLVSRCLFNCNISLNLTVHNEILSWHRPISMSLKFNDNNTHRDKTQALT